jgi:hypothetical protein
VLGTIAHEQRTSGNPAYQATDATGHNVGPVLPVLGAVVPQMKQAAAAAQEYVAAALAGEHRVGTQQGSMDISCCIYTSHAQAARQGA